MNKILEKATKIIEKAMNDENFLADNSDSMIAMGERQVDYCAYCLDLDDENFLIVDFTDFGFDDFSIVNKKQKALINDSMAEEE